MSGRYAIYFAPAADSPWRRFGARWLGRDEITGEPLPLPQPLPYGWTAEALRALTIEPRRYGWHATLKAPFRLREGAGPDELLAAMRTLARRLRPIPLQMLVPVYMDGFVALVPAGRTPSVDAVAALCVTELEPLRAPLTQEELARRNPQRQDERGRELLQRYGYPHVLERFRFHMTLTGPISAADAGRLIAPLARELAHLNHTEPPMLDRLCLFHEPEQGAAFLRVQDETFAL
ncbi:MAG TPA: DUF1045 domain-containing protein [Ramlibacter sp.]|nr:DUF1045 domain-containing protein [Ramlibacter sp.]